MIHLTRVQWLPGVHFIFATNDKPLSSEQAQELCEKYISVHHEKTAVNEALFVDLRKKRPFPSRDTEHATFVAVPIDYTLPKA